MSILHPLKRAKGLGSGHNGTHHFIVQRTSAIILIPLVLYFLYSIAHLAGTSYEEVRVWFANPFNAGMLIAFMLTGFYHAALGVQVVIEDYIHHEHFKWLLLIVVKGICVIGAIIAIASILRLALAH